MPLMRHQQRLKKSIFRIVPHAASGTMKDENIYFQSSLREIRLTLRYRVACMLEDNRIILCESQILMNEVQI